MSHVGRGRGYTGRHHMRELRPGDERDAELDAARTLAELSPRTTDPARIESKETMEPEKETAVEKTEKPPEDDATLKEMLRIDEQYVPLLTLLEQFSPGEDGIQFNRKLRHFETTVTNMCPDETRLHQAFATFRAAALLNSVTARKLAAVGASFTRQQRQQLLRGALLNVVMQDMFTKLDVLERSNPLFLINAANLMGDYFAEARLCNGNKVHILASPLLQYMRSLLACEDVRAHRSLATQLMQNGRELVSVLPAELEELSAALRARLVGGGGGGAGGAGGGAWLLLAADLCLNKFLPLPPALQHFYAAHLDLQQPADDFSEVSYGSWKKSPERVEGKEGRDAEGSKLDRSISQLSLNNNEDAKPKLRPILGAGAAMLRQEQALSVSQDTFDSWATAKTPLTKRYDLNSWRQQEEERKEEEFVQTSFVPDYPPPNVNRYGYGEFPNYLQQGDGAYIQNQQFSSPPPYNAQGDTFQPPPFAPDRLPPTTPTNDRIPTEQPARVTDRPAPQLPERVTNEVQKCHRASRQPVENWRKDKPEPKEDANRNRQRNWTRQRSKDNVSEEEDKDKSSKDRNPRAPRRRAHDARSYWDHDDRCQKDYGS